MLKIKILATNSQNPQDYTQNDMGILQLVDNRNRSISLEPSEKPSDLFNHHLSRKPRTYYHRLGHTDTFACKSCSQKGDRWYMGKHFWNGQREKKNK